MEWTPLHDAAAAGNAQAVLLLTAAGADVQSTVPSTGRAPLALAAEGSTATTVRELLQSGADAFAPDARGDTALYIAAESGNGDFIVALIESIIATSEHTLQCTSVMPSRRLACCFSGVTLAQRNRHCSRRCGRSCRSPVSDSRITLRGRVLRWFVTPYAFLYHLGRQHFLPWFPSYHERGPNTSSNTSTMATSMTKTRIVHRAATIPSPQLRKFLEATSPHSSLTPLLAAVSFGNVSAVRALLQAGASPYARERLPSDAVESDRKRLQRAVAGMLIARGNKVCVVATVRR